MNEPISDLDKKLRGTDRGSIYFAIELNKVRRNACIFFGVVVFALITFFAWNKWLHLITATLIFGATLFQSNIYFLSSELKRRS